MRWGTSRIGQEATCLPLAKEPIAKLATLHGCLEIRAFLVDSNHRKPDRKTTWFPTLHHECYSKPGLQMIVLPLLTFIYPDFLMAHMPATLLAGAIGSESGNEPRNWSPQTLKGNRQLDGTLSGSDSVSRSSVAFCSPAQSLTFSGIIRKTH